MARLQGAVVASSQCFGTSGRLALAPVADWLRNDAVQSAAATLDPAWRAEVGRLIPAEGHGGRGIGPRAMADAWQRHRFFEGLARALIAVGRPMLLVLDNMQWCDQETLAFITFCLGLASDTPLLVAGTLRDDNLGEDPELQEWTVRMRATGLLTELSLSPLDAADTAHLAQAISRQPLLAADADLLHATTGGFPLYVIEAVRGTADPGGTPLPTGDLQAVLRKRFEQATTAAREVAGLAAAVGTNFTLGLLTEASDLEADIVVQAVDELWRRRIMQEFGDGYDFSHDMLREAAYAEVSPPKRWLLHRRIAQGLELLHADDTDAVAAQLAEQYARGGRGDRAVAYYRRAADVAAARFALRRGDPAAPAGPVDHREDARGTRPGFTGARRPRGAGGTAQRQVRLLVPGAAADPGALDRPRRVTGPQGLDGRRHGRAVRRPGSCKGAPPTATRWPPARWPRRPGLRAERPGSFRRRRVGAQPGQARRGTAPSRTCRQAGRRGCLAEHRDPVGCAQHGLVRTRLLAAGP